MQPKQECFGHEISMADFFLDRTSLQDGVNILSEIQEDFETIYLKVREKEKRIYSDEELLNLPFATNSNPHKNEWRLRAKSFQRFTKYLQKKKSSLNILDLGCGNGWFSGQLSNSFNNIFYCVDVNLTELKQGRKFFKSEKLKFIYADIFSPEFPKNFFDIIIVNAAVQYFPEFKQLINCLLVLLNEKGEIHIIDSPIYTEDGTIKAKQRTNDYYSSLGFPEMSANYHHHSWNEVIHFNYKILYNPSAIRNKLKKLFTNDSPFPWIRITN